jgi:hypothetical protein
MGDVVYTSHVRVERIKGPLRRAELPHAEIEFGVHDEIADHYGVPRGSDAERATTLDYLTAAAVG